MQKINQQNKNVPFEVIQLKKQQNNKDNLVKQFALLKLPNNIQTTKKAKSLKVLCISDTHGKTAKTSILQQTGDIFICAGDFTVYNKEDDFFQFCMILQKLKFKHKIVIAGNHEVHFDQKIDPNGKRKLQNETNISPKQYKSILSRYCTYLEHQYIQVEGLRIFGSPYSLRHGSTAFGYQKQQAKYVWEQIPNVDILITHGPPKGILDTGKLPFKQLGCSQLLITVMRIKPKYHIFGHIHESSGKIQKSGINFINAAQCGSGRRLINRPYKFQINFQ